MSINIRIGEGGEGGTVEAVRGYEFISRACVDWYSDEAQALHDHFMDESQHDVPQHYCIYYSPDYKGWVGEVHDGWHCYLSESVDIAHTKKLAIQRYVWSTEAVDGLTLRYVNIAKNKNSGAPC